MKIAQLEANISALMRQRCKPKTNLRKAVSLGMVVLRFVRSGLAGAQTLWFHVSYANLVVWSMTFLPMLQESDSSRIQAALPGIAVTVSKDASWISHWDVLRSFDLQSETVWTMKVWCLSAGGT